MRVIPALEVEGYRLVFEPPDLKRLGIASRNMFIIGRKSDLFYVQKILERMKANPSEIALVSSGIYIKTLLKVLLTIVNMRRYYVWRIYLWLERMAPIHHSKHSDIYVVRMLVVLRKLAKYNKYNILSQKL